MGAPGQAGESCPFEFAPDGAADEPAMTGDVNGAVVLQLHGETITVGAGRRQAGGGLLAVCLSVGRAGRRIETGLGSERICDERATWRWTGVLRVRIKAITGLTILFVGTSIATVIPAVAAGNK